MKKLRILALVHKHLVPPDDTTGVDVVERRVEDGVRRHRHARGSAATRCWSLGVHDDLSADPRRRSTEFKPDIVFNLLEGFADVNTFDQNVVSYLELLRMPYTGCNPRGLMLARDKSLGEEAAHLPPRPGARLHGRAPRARASRPTRLRFPLIVKSLVYEASIGISQASVVENEEQLARAGAVRPREPRHGRASSSEFIDGRELYVGVHRQRAPAGVPGVGDVVRADARARRGTIATERVKWSTKYQKKHGIMTDEAESCRRPWPRRSSTRRSASTGRST